jgi:small multidrug resistance pump
MLANLIVGAYAITTSLALIFLKLGTTNVGSPIAFVNNKLALNLGYYSVAGILLYGLSFLIYTYLVSKYDLGYIIPITTALVYILIFIASFVIFKETFTTLKILAIALILVGIVLLNVSK